MLNRLKSGANLLIGLFNVLKNDTLDLNQKEVLVKAFIKYIKNWNEQVAPAQLAISKEFCQETGDKYFTQPDFFFLSYDEVIFENKTCLVLAAENGYTNIAKMLIEAKASAVISDPLLAASKQGHAETIRLLVEHKADVNHGQYSAAPLHWSCYSGHIPATITLLELKADINLVGRNHTPLAEAVNGGSTAMVSLLLEKNANPDVKDENGKTILERALHCNQFSIAYLLFSENEYKYSDEAWTFFQGRDFSDFNHYCHFMRFCPHLPEAAGQFLLELNAFKLSLEAPLFKALNASAVRQFPREILELVVGYDYPLSRVGMFKPCQLKDKIKELFPPKKLDKK